MGCQCNWEVHGTSLNSKYYIKDCQNINTSQKLISTLGKGYTLYRTGRVLDQGDQKIRKKNCPNFWKSNQKVDKSKKAKQSTF